MIGREKKEYNDLFFVCSLVEYVARKTKNRRSTVVSLVGKDRLKHIYDLADVYHSENIDKVSDELIEKANIPDGTFDNVSAAKYRIPTHWDIGKVYQRLIIDICNGEGKEPVDALIDAYNSPIAGIIDDYNNSMYFENPGYIYASYLNGKPLE